MSSSPTSSSSSDAPASGFAGLHDVRCSVEVIVGSGSITVRECLELQRDSIIRLAQPAGSELVVLIQKIAAATGEIVMDRDTTSVRISEVLPPAGSEVPS